MHGFTDQIGHTIFPGKIPQRIISLVPSQTELLFDLGLDKEVVGITKFCVHPPEWHFTKSKVGGTKKLHTNIIQQLQPDLVLANKEENVKEQIEELSLQYPVWTSDIHDLDSAIEMIAQVGLLTGKAEKAGEIIRSISKEFAQLQQEINPVYKNIQTAYFIWQDPYMTIGTDTFIHAMLEAAGFTNIFADKTRYPQATIEELKARNVELILLSSEPFPFKQKQVDELRAILDQNGLAKTTIMLIDGEMFSWYGSHLQYAPQYFIQLRKLARDVHSNN